MLPSNHLALGKNDQILAFTHWKAKQYYNMGMPCYYEFSDSPPVVPIIAAFLDNWQTISAEMKDLRKYLMDAIFTHSIKGNRWDFLMVWIPALRRSGLVSLMKVSSIAL